MPTPPPNLVAAIPGDDRALVTMLLGGDERAFERFFNNSFPRLYRFVLPRAGRDASVAEELCQQTLARAIPRLGTWRGEASLFTWLCQIARHELSDYWQRQQRESAHLVQFDDDAEIRAVLESIEAPESERPEAIGQQGELARLVQLTLDCLPPHYAAVLEWQYIDGLTVQQIADRQCQTLIAAQSVLARARRAFQDAFVSLGAGLIDDLIDRSPGIAAGVRS